MLGELTSEITRYMDKQVDPKHRLKGFEVYIYTKKNEEGKLVPLEQETSYDDKLSFWYIRYPGYTCGNVVFDKETRKVLEILLTRRNMNPPTVFIDPDKLEKELNKKFKGTVISYDEGSAVDSIIPAETK